MGRANVNESGTGTDSVEHTSIRRRRFLRSAAAAGVVGLAGCLSNDTGNAGGAGNAGNTGNEGSVETVESLPAPVQGDPDADVTVAVFEDYACSHCRQFVVDVLPDVRSEFVEPGRVRYEHHDFPIPVSRRWSWAVPSAARSVQDERGDDAFFAYADRLFRNQSNYSYDLVASLASEVDADPPTVRRAAETETYRPVLEADRERGTDMGLQGTPEVYVDGGRTADYSYETVRGAIERAL